LDHCPVGFRRWYAGGYETLVRNKPGVWGHLYRSSDRPLFNFWFQTMLDRSFCSRLELLITVFKPDWIVCTHSLPQPMLTALQKAKGFKTAVVVTDIYPHRMWLRGHVDRYFVPAEMTKETLRRRRPGFQREIDVVGMPIGGAFTSGHPREMPILPNVLLTAGGIGGGPLGLAATALAALPLELTVVCGDNKDAYAQLSAQFEGRDVRILGRQSQEEMAALLRETDILVSKPGGLATFESLACGCAFVILHELLIPGQEEGNGRFLEEIGSGVSARTVTDLPFVVGRLLKDRERLMAMQQAALRHAAPDAAKAIVDYLTEEPLPS
jgi:processive 1,2-diacylglycerol beta-glucosyltransferase